MPSASRSEPSKTHTPKHTRTPQNDTSSPDDEDDPFEFEFPVLENKDGVDDHIVTSFSSQRCKDKNGFLNKNIHDFDGNGLGDYAVSSIHARPLGRKDAGMVSVLLGRSKLELEQEAEHLSTHRGFNIFGAHKGDQLGYGLSGLGDINGDKKADLLACSPFADADDGECYVILGNSSPQKEIDLRHLKPEEGFVIKGGAPRGLLGLAAGPGGDINRDGFNDILISERGSNKVHIVYGKNDTFAPIFNINNMNRDEGFTITTNHTDTTFGFAVNTAKDVNGDGFADTLISDPQNNIVYLVLGRANFPSSVNIYDTAPIIHKGEYANGHFGSALSPAGDPNNDKHADYLIGDDKASPFGRTDAGNAYLFWGKGNYTDGQIIKAQDIKDHGIVFKGANPCDRTGKSVSYTYHDDQYSCVVGAPHFSGEPNKHGSGRVWSYFYPKKGLNSGRTYILFTSRFANQANCELQNQDVGEAIDLRNLQPEEGIYITGNAGDLLGTSVDGLNTISEHDTENLLMSSLRICGKNKRNDCQKGEFSSASRPQPSEILNLLMLLIVLGKLGYEFYQWFLTVSAKDQEITPPQRTFYSHNIEKRTQNIRDKCAFHLHFAKPPFKAVYADLKEDIDDFKGEVTKEVVAEWRYRLNSLLKNDVYSYDFFKPAKNEREARAQHMFQTEVSRSIKRPGGW